MNIKYNIKKIKNQIPKNCCLVAVSKTKPIESIWEAYHLGHRDFGENRVQELIYKCKQLPKDIKWHLIGHLQRNKVKQVIDFVYLIHGVDSERLMDEINKQAQKHGRTVDCLLQVHIAKEESKFGFQQKALEQIANKQLQKNWSHIHIKGLMGIATHTDDKDQIIQEFKSLERLFLHFKKCTHPHFHMTYLSMGMTNDYPLAIVQGSNLIRVGSAIFGSREAH